MIVAVLALIIVFSILIYFQVLIQKANKELIVFFKREVYLKGWYKKIAEDIYGVDTINKCEEDFLKIYKL